VDVLVVKAHEGELNAFELAFLDAGFRRIKAHAADFLPVSIRGLTFANARYFQDRGAQIIRSSGCLRDGCEATSGDGSGKGGCALQHAAAAHHHIIKCNFHFGFPPNWTVTGSVFPGLLVRPFS
jgi:hypothetical protein